MFRQITDALQTQLNTSNPPILLLMGMRQVGKSTLAYNLAQRSTKPFTRFNFDLISDIQEFTNQTRHSLATFAENYKGHLIIIDEIQKAPEATAIVKHLYDNYHFPFILTGSSEVKIRRGIGDSLLGRLHEVKLYPLTLQEISTQKIEPDTFDTHQKNLLNYLVFGSLPHLLNAPATTHATYLLDYVNTLISKDVLELAGTRKSTQIFLLAKLLALQIGQLVSFSELAINTELSRETVYRYIDIFEQMGIIIRAKPISTNERESISKAAKIYFTDLGIRNALINNFDPFQIRLDKGQLLENAVFVGMKKQLDYSRIQTQLGFFRSPSGQEIDIVQKNGQEQKLFEVKTNYTHKGSTKRQITYITLSTAHKYI